MRAILLRLWRLCLLCAFLATPAWGGQLYTFAIVPHYTPVDIGLRWTPLLKRLEADTGVGFQLRIADGAQAFEADFLRGGPDFVYLNSYHMVMAARAQGYAPLVRGAKPLSGILVVDGEGPVKSLPDLNGARIAFPSPNSFGASLYMRALLAEKERVQFTPVYVGTHQNVFRHVLLRDEMAGGSIETTLQREPAPLQRRLRVLYKTPEAASHPIAVHPRVPPELRDRIVRALLALRQDATGRKLLDDVELGGLQVADYRQDYQPLETLRLERYVLQDRK